MYYFSALIMKQLHFAGAGRLCHFNFWAVLMFLTKLLAMLSDYQIESLSVGARISGEDNVLQNVVAHNQPTNGQPNYAKRAHQPATAQFPLWLATCYYIIAAAPSAFLKLRMIFLLPRI